MSPRVALHGRSPVAQVARRWAWRVARAAWWWAGAATALVLAWWQPAGLQRLNLLAYDLLLPVRAPSAQAPVVVAIDDASLARLGSWPWPRALHARLIDRLHAAGASSIGVAVLFSEPDRQDPASDQALVDAVARHGRVMLAVAPSRQPDGSVAREPLGPRLAHQVAPLWLGHVDVEIDIDGQSRSVFLQAGLGQANLPALARAVHLLASRPAGSLPAAAPTSPGCGATKCSRPACKRWRRCRSPKRSTAPRSPMPCAGAASSSASRPAAWATTWPHR